MGEHITQLTKIHPYLFKTANIEKYNELEEQYTERAKKFCKVEDRHGTVDAALYETRRLEMLAPPGVPIGYNGIVLCEICQNFINRPYIWNGLIPHHECTPNFRIDNDIIDTIFPLTNDIEEAKKQTDSNAKLIPKIRARDRVLRLMKRHGVSKSADLVALGVVDPKALEQAGIGI